MTTRELRNRVKLGTLHPEFLVIAELLVQRLELAGARPLIVQARRTIAEQDALYAQGRSAPGKVVTMARGGYSWHNFGLAVDIVDVAASGNPDAYDESDWAATGYKGWPQIGLGLGLGWGSMWTHPDMPHVEWHPSYGPSDAHLLLPLADALGVLPEKFFSDRGLIGPHETSV